MTFVGVLGSLGALRPRHFLGLLAEKYVVHIDMRRGSMPTASHNCRVEFGRRSTSFVINGQVAVRVGWWTYLRVSFVTPLD